MSAPQARGRARGRSRGSQQDESRRPGGDGAAPGAEAASGRAAHRGGMSERPGGELPSIPVDQLQQLALGAAGGNGGGDRRGGRLRYHDPHTRPAHIQDKTGNGGTPITLVSNYYPVSDQPSWSLSQYHVSFNPEVDSIGQRKFLLRSQKDKIGNEYLFDGMILFSSANIPVDTNKKATMTAVRDTDGAHIQITLTFTKSLTKDDPQCLQLYSILIRRSIRELGLKMIQRSNFDPKAAAKVPQHKMEVWPGYQTSVHSYDQGVMLCSELTFKVLSTETVLDKMYEMYNRGGAERFHDEASRKFIGSIVMTRHNSKTYRIDDIDWEKRVTDTFKKGDADISYKQYFEQQYGISIADDNQPLFLHRPKKREQRKMGKGETGPGPEEERIIYLPPEICTLTGIPDEMRADYRVMNDLAQHTRVAPPKRMEQTDNIVRRMNTNEVVQKLWSAWGVELDNTHINVQGRVLQSEDIYQGQKKYTYRSTDADWTRDMRDAQMDIAVNLTNWLCICTKRDTQTCSTFVSSLSRVCPPMGIRIEQPNVIQLDNDRISSYVEAINNNVRPDTGMVMIMLPNNRKDRYDAVKTVLCCDLAVPSQCIVAKTVSNPKKTMSIATKVAIQMNCKMGGAAWGVAIPVKGLMICGIDSYHDSAQRGRSVGAFVATFNQKCTRYYAKTSFQSSHQEMLDGLKLSATAALKNYFKVNNAFPSTIVVYRDGVGAGQIGQVFEKEVPDINAAFKSVASEDLKMSFIIVTKRITTRFFSKTGNQLTNPPAGTVIDKGVTKPERYDFYIVSQSVRQGSVSPTSYNCIYDTSNFKPDHQQRLAYKMTHLYYNWPGTVRVPAPCMYAHKLAFLTGQSLHKDFHESLADRLFFI